MAAPSPPVQVMEVKEESVTDEEPVMESNDCVEVKEVKDELLTVSVPIPTDKRCDSRVYEAEERDFMDVRRIEPEDVMEKTPEDEVKEVRIEIVSSLKSSAPDESVKNGISVEVNPAELKTGYI